MRSSAVGQSHASDPIHLQRHPKFAPASCWAMCTPQLGFSDDACQHRCMYVPVTLLAGQLAALALLPGLD
jgi:hypothetical protein